MNAKSQSIIIIPILIIGFALAQNAQALNPPPDGGYPGGNTAEGQNALFSLTSGGYNTAVGWFSLRNDTTSNFNTAVGAGTLFANSGDENTATGTAALLSNTTGVANTANGAFALLSNTAGAFNTANGDSALFSNTVGAQNTATGFNTLTSNTTGDDNVAIGDSALNSNTTGILNTAIGEGALRLCTGDENTAVGQGAGFGITTGNNITAIGPVLGVSTTNGQVDDSCYIANIFEAEVDAGTAAFVFVDQDGKLGTMALPNTGTLQNTHALSGKVRELEATVGLLIQQLKEQAAQIQTVNAQLAAASPSRGGLEESKPAPQVVNNP